MSRYAFVVDETPSFEEVTIRIKADPALPDDLRAQLAVGVDALLDCRHQPKRFAELTACTTPFTPEVVAGLLRTFSGNASERARIEVAVAAITPRYQLGVRARFKPLPAWAGGITAFDPTASYRCRHLQRFLAFNCDRESAEAALAAPTLAAFDTAVNQDPSVQHADEIRIQTRRALNWAAESVGGWPQIEVPMPKVRKVKGLPWSAFPDALRENVEATLQRRPGLIDWDDRIIAAFARDPSGLHHSLELTRICLGVLVAAGIAADAFQTVRDIVLPERFKSLAKELRRASGGAVTRLDRTKLATIHALAVRYGALDDDGLTEINEAMIETEKSARLYCKSNPPRRDHAVRKTTSREVLQELHSKVHAIYRAPTPARVTRAYAGQMKQAAIVALKIETGLETMLIRVLDPVRHFYELGGDETEGIQIVIPAEENPKRMDRRCLLSPETSELIRHYIREFRPKLDICGQSRFLFPGSGVSPLHPSTMSTQQVKFYRETLKTELTPECIRLLIEQLILRRDPAATGVVADVLGWRDTDYVLRRAEPYRQRARREDGMRLTTSGRLK